MAGIEELRKGLEINSTKLDDELSKQASFYLFVAEKAVEAEARYLMTKKTHEELVANLDYRIRSSLERDGKRATEKMVESYRVADTSYQDSLSKVNTARVQRDMIKALREAWYMRKDLLIRMAINHRAEIEGLSQDVIKENQ